MPIATGAFCADNRAMQADDTTSTPDPLPTTPDSSAPAQRPQQPSQPRNPLHGLTLEAIVTQLADFYGWDDLGQRIPVRCFTHEPSVELQPEVFAQNPLGTREGGKSLPVHAARPKTPRLLIGLWQTVRA
jgi:hypothetical protein